MLIDYHITALIPNSELAFLLTPDCLPHPRLISSIIHAANVPPGAQVEGYFLLGQGRVSIVIPDCEDNQALRERMSAHLRGSTLAPRIAKLEAELASLRALQGNSDD